jgi:hypothetical protein
LSQVRFASRLNGEPSRDGSPLRRISRAAQPKDKKMLNGYKTYVVAALAVLGALGGWLDGDMTLVAALNLAVPALLAMTVRHGIASTGV